MPRTTTQRAIHRLRILHGLLEKLETSVREEKYCIDVLGQSLAIQKALKSLDALLLEQHLNSCVRKEMKPGKKSSSLRKELLTLYKIAPKDI